MVRLQVFLSLRLFCPSFFVYGRVYFLSFNTILIYLPKKKSTWDTLLFLPSKGLVVR